MWNYHWWRPQVPERGNDFKGENLRPVRGMWPCTYNILIDDISRKVYEVVFNPAIIHKTIHVTQVLWERAKKKKKKQNNPGGGWWLFKAFSGTK